MLPSTESVIPSSPGSQGRLCPRQLTTRTGRSRTEATRGDHVPKTASEAVEEHQLSEGRREKAARHSSLGHSWRQERQNALVIRMALEGEGESPVPQGVRGEKSRQRLTWKGARPLGFRSGLLGAGKASFGECSRDSQKQEGHVLEGEAETRRGFFSEWGGLSRGKKEAQMGQHQEVQKTGLRNEVPESTCFSGVQGQNGR